MKRRHSFFAALALGAALVAPLATVGCAEHHYYRVYDPYYHDYHNWNAQEQDYYRQWARENHRDEHQDFRKLNKDDQQRYWQWRHGQANNQGHDHDHDHDNDHH